MDYEGAISNTFFSNDSFLNLQRRTQIIKGSNQPTIYALMIDTLEFSYRRSESDNTIHHQHNFKSHNEKPVII